MVYIFKDRLIRVEWTIYKGISPVKEDFSRSNVKVFLLGNREKYLLQARADKGTLYVDIPSGLEEGTYSIEAIWVKNMDHVFDTRSVCRSKKEDLFSITEFEDEATNIGEGVVVLKVKTSTATYGYDGLSSYELAVLRGDWSGTEGEWLKHERYVSVLDSRGDSEVDTMSQKAITDELEKQDEAIEDIRNDTNDLGDRVEEAEDKVNNMGNIVDEIKSHAPVSARPAGFKPDIDLTPEITVDRAWRDHEGNVIRDTYITRRGLRNEIIDITNQQVTDLKPGSVDPDDLSEATKQLIGNKSITNLPDEEDITVTDNQTLKLKDKEYAPKDYSGMGRVYLRKHYVNGVNTLTQHMMRKPNTIYIIQYDYCLAEQTIEVPENCVLDFQGGSFRNGTIVGNETRINAGLDRVFGLGMSIDGNWNIRETYPEWFGAKPDNTTDSTLYIQSALSFAENNKSDLVLSSGVYIIANTIYVKKQSYVHIIGKGRYKTFIELHSKDIVNSMIDINSSEVPTYYQYIQIKGISLYVNGNAQYGIYCPKITLSLIDDVSIFGANYYDLDIEYGWSNMISQCLFSRSKNGVHAYRSANNNLFVNCLFSFIEGIGIYFEATDAVQLINCDFEFVKGVPVYIKGRVNNLLISGCYFEGNNELGMNFQYPKINIKSSVIINGSELEANDKANIKYNNRSINIINNYFNESNTNSVVYAISVDGLIIDSNYSFLRKFHAITFPISDDITRLGKISVKDNNNLNDLYLDDNTSGFLTRINLNMNNHIRLNYLPSIFGFVKGSSDTLQLGKYTDKFNTCDSFIIQQSAPNYLYYTVNNVDALKGKLVQFKCKYKILTDNTNLMVTVNNYKINESKKLSVTNDWIDCSIYVYIPKSMNELVVSLRIYSNSYDNQPTIAITQPVLDEVGFDYSDYIKDNSFNKMIGYISSNVFGNGWEEGDIVYFPYFDNVTTPYVIYHDGKWFNSDGTLYDKVFNI